MSGAPAELQQALLATLAFQTEGERAGNVVVGQGRIGDRRVRVGLVENRAASGSIGKAEAERLGAMLRVAAAEPTPVVLWLDSAGARVSEGLHALGAFRLLYRAGLDAARQGVPIAAVLGRNCYGGSSMLAHLAGRRLFAPATQMAMSGPAVIASASGLDPLDEMFRAMADATLAASARAQASSANTVWAPGQDLGEWLREALAPRGDAVGAFRMRHEALAARFQKMPPERPREVARRRDLERVYAGNYEAFEGEGILEGRGMRDGAEERFVGLVGKGALNAVRAFRFADLVWRHVDAPPPRLQVWLDCASHAARLDDEKLVLTEYIVDMGLALASLATRGTRVELTIAGEAGGGVYVALAAPADRVASVHGANIQVLPGAAVAAILGESRDSAPSFDEYRSARVADVELKLGLVPGAT